MDFYITSKKKPTKIADFLIYNFIKFRALLIF
jgi:hypothetical protein